MKTIEYLDAVKQRHSLPSDYALAKLLRVDQTTISTYRSGRGEMDATTAVKVAELLAVNPLSVIASVELARAKKDDARKIWLRYAAVVVLSTSAIGGGPDGPGNATAGTIEHNQNSAGLNTHSRISRRTRRQLAAAALAALIGLFPAPRPFAN